MADKTIEYKIIIDDANSAKTLSQLEDSAERLNAELKDLDPRSQDFKNLAKAAQGVNKEIEDIGNSINGLNFEDKIQAFDGGMKILAGSTQAVVGGFGLLGIESEKLAFLEKQAANAIAFGLGLKDLSEGLGQVAIAFNKAGIGADLFGKVTKKALISTGIGALVVALGVIVAYWDEINEFIAGTNDLLVEQNGLLEEQITAGDENLTLLELQATNTELRGESTVRINEEIRKQLLLQLENNTLLLENLELQLEKEKAQNRELTFWEKVKFGAASALSPIRGATALLEATNEESEKTEDLSNKIFDAKKRQLDIEKQILLIGQKQREEAELIAFANREPEQKLEIATIGLTDANKDKLKSDADFNNLLLYQKKKADDEYTAAVLNNQMKLNEARFFALDNLMMLAGRETAIGRSLLIAKQVLAAKELIMEAKKTITFTTLKASEATVATATGAAKTAAIGFPQNIPLLIAYAVQAAGIIAAVVSATRSAKSAARGVGAGGGPTVATPRVPTSGGAPTTRSSTAVDQIDVAEASFQNQNSIRAYVVNGDVRSSQEANAKIQARRTLAG